MGTQCVAPLTFGTRIVWRGIGYDMVSTKETVILHRPAQRGQTGKVAKPRKRPSSAPSSSQSRN
jgi:hypothetical protein